VANDVDEIADERSRAAVERHNRTVTAEIEAADPVALRAACNTWCSLVEVAATVAALPDECTSRSSG
jgi:KEOPS complex subunit Pcc1